MLLMFDPGVSLTGAKKYLASNGFTEGFGTEEVISKFQTFVKGQTTEGTYAGKSMKLGEGGRAALFKHLRIITGEYGENLTKIDGDAWESINNASKMNYMTNYLAKGITN
jgi:hypothetical protein